MILSMTSRFHPAHRVEKQTYRRRQSPPSSTATYSSDNALFPRQILGTDLSVINPPSGWQGILYKTPLPNSFVARFGSFSLWCFHVRFSRRLHGDLVQDVGGVLNQARDDTVNHPDLSIKSPLQCRQHCPHLTFHCLCDWSKGRPC